MYFCFLGDELLTNPDDTPLTTVPVNGTLKKKGRLYRRIRMRGSKPHQLKEVDVNSFVQYELLGEIFKRFSVCYSCLLHFG